MDWWWTSWFFLPFPSYSCPSFCLFSSSSVRSSGGWLCPHALCLHAQQPAVPSTHGTISFLPLLTLRLHTHYFFFFIIHNVCASHLSGRNSCKCITATRMSCWQPRSETDWHGCYLLHTITVLLTASWIVQLTSSACGSAEAAVDPPALMNCSPSAHLPSHLSNKL